jgi:hypothetical protein
MRFGFKNTLAKVKKFGKNAYEKIQVLGQKINENKKLIGMLGGLLLATAGAGAGARHYDKKGKEIQGKIDAEIGGRVSDRLDREDAQELYNMFPSVPTTLPKPPPPSRLPTDIWG